jgi:hypothetical protein
MDLCACHPGEHGPANQAKSQQCCDQFHFIVPHHCHCSIPSRGLFPIMFKSTSADLAKLKNLTKIMLKTPNLQLQHAMKAANYSDNEIPDIAFRCFLQQALLGGLIKGLRAHVAAGLPAPPDCTYRQHVRANPTAITSIKRTPSIQNPAALDVPREPVIGITPSSALPHVHLPSADDAVTPVAAGLSKRITASKRTLYNKTHYLKKNATLCQLHQRCHTPAGHHHHTNINSCHILHPPPMGVWNQRHCAHAGGK